jgi:methyl-accepting chemotaxis protein
LNLELRSLRSKLILLIAALLAANLLFVLLFFPSRMAAFSSKWVERRAVGMSIVLAGAAAPGFEFDDSTNIRELLGAGAARAPEVLYAGVRRANGTVLGAWHPELMPPAPDHVGLEPLVRFDRDRVVVEALVQGKAGAPGTLSIGFALNELAREERANLVTVAAVSLLVFGIGLVLAFFIGTLVVRPIRRMTDVALRIAEGDLSHGDLIVDRVDEVGEMATAFNRMVAEQRNVVRQIASTSGQLTGAAAELYAAAQKQETAAESQSEQMTEASTTVQSLLDSASQIAEAARGVLDNAQRTRETTEISAQRIGELSTHAARIAELLEVIRDIADRSDLLALNASLEATRAGETGRGFTLVAGEMRRLAERVTASVEDVKTLLVDVKTSGSSSVQATEEGRKLAESTTDSARDITLVTQQQRSATEQVSQTMRQISKVLSSSLTTTQQTRSSAELLKSQSAELERVIGRFRLSARREP